MACIVSTYNVPFLHFNLRQSFVGPYAQNLTHLATHRLQQNHEMHFQSLRTKRI